MGVIRNLSADHMYHVLICPLPSDPNRNRTETNWLFFLFNTNGGMPAKTHLDGRIYVHNSVILYNYINAPICDSVLPIKIAFMINKVQILPITM